MKTWQSILMNLALIFGAAFVPQIKDPNIQKAVYGSMAVIGAAGAKINSESDQSGNKLPPVQ